MVPLFRWLHEHTSLFRQTAIEQAKGYAVRREVTVERKERTVMVGPGELRAWDTCPLCGQKIREGSAPMVDLSRRDPP